MIALRQHLSLTACIATLVTLTGCLASSYRVSEDELERIVEIPPEQRGGALRVVQRLSWDDEPPEVAPDRVSCGDRSHYSGHLHIYAHHHHGHGGGAAVKGGSSGGGGGGNSIGGGKEMAALVVVAAALFTVGLVATEGARWDGWVSVAPDHPVHLLYPDDTTSTVSLAELRAEDLDGPYEAVISEHRGWGMDLKRRAPLSREGFAWKFEMGSMELSPPGEARPMGLAALVELGYFPTQHVGLLGFLTLSGDTHEGKDVLAIRYGAEIQAMPLRLGRLHLGGYGAAGLTYDGVEGPTSPRRQSSDTMFGAGALAELDLSTRLALSVRAGLTWITRDGEVEDPTFMTTVGLAVY